MLTDEEVTNFQEVQTFAISLAKLTGAMILEASKARLAAVNGEVKEKKSCSFFHCGYG